MGDESVGAEAVFPVFACISFALQRYEKKLKLTNYKHKTLEKFCIGASILLCIKQLHRSFVKTLCTRVFREFLHRFL